jgi:hypothetical protein
VASIPVPKNARYIGQCIYCDTSEGPLSKEHAVPYALNGPLTLLKASCPSCANITHRFERDCLREFGLYSAIRAVLRMQTRRKRPTVLPLVLESNGGQQNVQIPVADYPLYLPTPHLPQPGAVTGAPITQDVHVDLKFIHITGPSFSDFSQIHTDAEFIGARLSFSPELFLRTLAKIGFCVGVYTLGLAPLRQSPIRQVILGADRDAWHWVGSWTGDQMNEPRGLHRMQIRASGSDIHVILRLFAQFGAPEYHIVLGAADPEFVKSDAWPWK